MNSIKKRWQMMMEDIAVDLKDEFVENFRRQGFFGKKWKPVKFRKSEGILIGHGRLWRSIRAERTMNSITFSSDTPYASIHNEGGEIEVTKKMKGYFWYMYGQTGYEPYKAMAMKRVGSKITIPQRQFVGYHKDIDKIVERCAKDMVEDVLEEAIRRRR